MESFHSVKPIMCPAAALPGVCLPVAGGKESGNENGRQNCGRIESVELQPVLFQRLVEQVAERRLRAEGAVSI
jgi:hypothetical protein